MASPEPTTGNNPNDVGRLDVFSVGPVRPPRPIRGGSAYIKPYERWRDRRHRSVHKGRWRPNGLNRALNEPEVDPKCDNGDDDDNVLLLNGDEEMLRVRFPSMTMQIRIADFVSLANGALLNDTIVDFYLNHIVAHMLPDSASYEISILPSSFWHRLRTTAQSQSADHRCCSPLEQCFAEEQQQCAEPFSERTYTNCWVNEVNIFRTDYIVIPIIEQQHWMMAIVCNPRFSAKRRRSTSKRRHPAFEHASHSTSKRRRPAPFERASSATSKRRRRARFERASCSISKECRPAPFERDCTTNGQSSSGVGGDEQQCSVLFFDSQQQQQQQQCDGEDSRDSSLATSVFRTVSRILKHLLMIRQAPNSGDSDGDGDGDNESDGDMEDSHQLTDGLWEFDQDSLNYVIPTNLPQQRNNVDCGLYILEYARCFLLNPINIPTASSSFDFAAKYPEFSVQHKRLELQRTILSLCANADSRWTILLEASEVAATELPDDLLEQVSSICVPHRFID